ncbi:hypothetical protein AAE478_008612 [Parahypoxylon ruwenzoriense]
MLRGPRAAQQLCLRRATTAALARPLVLQVRSSNPTIRISRPSLPSSLPRALSPRTPRLVFTTSQRCSAEPAPASTLPDQPNATPPESPLPNPPRHHRRRRRRRRGLYLAAASLLCGVALGSLIRLTLAPPGLPEPGSEGDAYLLQRIRADAEKLAVVRQLSADPSWESWDAYSGLEAAEPRKVVRSRITSGPLAGARGLAYQRIYHNPSSGEVTSVVYFGLATAGWPGIVHGGALATVLDESLGRCAILRFPARTGVTATIDLKYRAPTLTNGYYVVRTRPLLDKDHDPAKSDRKMWVEGTIETEAGKVCVEAKALFVVPKGVKLKPLVEGF